MDFSVQDRSHPLARHVCLYMPSLRSPNCLLRSSPVGMPIFLFSSVPSPPGSLTLTSLVFPEILGPRQPQYFLLSPTASLGNAHYLLSPAPLPGGQSFPSLAWAMGSRAGAEPWHSHVPFTVWAPASKSAGTQKRNPEAPSPCSVIADWGTLGNSVCQPIPTPSANCLSPHTPTCIPGTGKNLNQVLCMDDLS